MSFEIITHHRTEVLLDELLDRKQSRPPADPFLPQYIVVQSKGMERWLSLHIAEALGICANVRFPFPNSFVAELQQALELSLPVQDYFSPDRLSWSIFFLLQQKISNTANSSSSDYDELSRLIQQQTKESPEYGEWLWQKNLYHVSQKIAELFDSYLTYRPNLIQQFEQGPKPKQHKWQADLWRSVLTDIKSLSGTMVRHKQEQKQMLIETLQKPDMIKKLRHNFPPQIFLFGISYLPPFHMEILYEISHYIDIAFFLLNPSRQFWQDIVSGYTAEIIIAQQSQWRQDEDELYLETGNPLLSTMGGLMQDFHKVINGFEHIETLELDVARRPQRSFPILHSAPQAQGEESSSKPKSILLHMQDEIRDLRRREWYSEGNPSIENPIDIELDQLLKDFSISIHSAHSKRRELEILHNFLLFLLERDPTLRVDDILIMTPNLEEYAPYIEAIFDQPGDSKLRLPFAVSDRSAAMEQEVVRGFFELLELPHTRFQASYVMGLLSLAPIREHFGIDEAQLEQISYWLQELAIYWGADGAMKDQLGIRDSAENTWKQGLDRLILGLLYPPESHGSELEQGLVVNGLIPYSRISEASRELLTGFINFFEMLRYFFDRLQEPYTPSEWQGILLQLLYGFMGDISGDFREPQRERDAAKSLLQQNIDRINEAMGHEQPIYLYPLQQQLQDLLVERKNFHPFYSGKITFAAMLPMRTIPFRVIAMIGMNDGVFPRQNPKESFDLSGSRQPGDRSLRNEDLYIFLETLISAREFLYISYLGAEVKENTPVPPSLAVNELIEYLNSSFRVINSNAEDSDNSGSYQEKMAQDNNHQPQKIGDFIYQRHPLHSWSALYDYQKQQQKDLADTRLLPAYDPRFVAQRDTNQTSPSKLLPETLPLPDPKDNPEFFRISVDEWLGFWQNPAKAFLRRRNHIYLDEYQPLQDSEPQELNTLESSIQGNNILGDWLARGIEGNMPPTRDKIYRILRGSGRLPHEQLGRYYFERMFQTVLSLWQTYQQFRHKHGLQQNYATKSVNIAKEITVNGQTIPFEIYGELPWVADDHLLYFHYSAASERHKLRVWLILQLLTATQNPLPVLHLAKGHCHLCPAIKSENLIETLIGFYLQGMQRPLPFFPRATINMCSDLIKQESEEKIWQKWLFNMTEAYQGPREIDDPYFYFAFFRHNRSDSTIPSPREMAESWREEFFLLARQICHPYSQSEEACYD